MFAPIVGVAAHHLPLGVVERTLLVQHGVRDRDLADVVQLGRTHELRHLRLGHAEPGGDSVHEGCDVLGVLLEIGLLHAQGP